MVPIQKYQLMKYGVEETQFIKAAENDETNEIGNNSTVLALDEDLDEEVIDWAESVRRSRTLSQDIVVSEEYRLIRNVE